MLLLIFVAWILASANSVSQYRGYTRYDMPYTYRVTTIQAYMVPKRNAIAKQIQYAPLILKPQELNTYDTYTTLSTIKTNERLTKNNDDRRLEPHLSEEKNFYHRNKGLSYVPGYNLQLQSLKYSGKEINNEKLSEKKNDVILEYNRKMETTEKPVYNKIQNDIISPENVPYPKVILDLDKNKLDHENNRYAKTLSALETPNIQPYLVVKTPRLHLNVARAHNFAFVPNKALPQLNEIILRKITTQNKKNEHKTYLSSISNKNNCHLHHVH